MKKINNSSLLNYKLNLIIFFIIGLIFPYSILYSKNKNMVAKVILIRGVVKSKDANNEIIKLTKGMWVKEGTVIKTKKKSFVKLLFVDKSQMSLGPNSEMKIKAFPKKDAGIISLVKGQLRSKVTKNYMGIKNKNKSKLFIKTRTAAMGVRGTDFQINYNPANNNTSLITFEGAVAFSKFSGGDLSQSQLEKIVSSPNAVIVRRGQFSGVGNLSKVANVPVKMSPSQFSSMKKNEQAKPTQNKGQTGKKRIFKSPLPPGVNPKSFSDKKQMSKIESNIAKTLGDNVVKSINTEVAAINETTAKEPTAAGSDNQMLTPGGLFDAKTVQYIAPPKDSSTYDSISKTFIAPPEYGTFDAATGDYVNPNFELENDGTFTAKSSDVEVTVTPKTINDTTTTSATNPDDSPDNTADTANEATKELEESSSSTDSEIEEIIEETREGAASDTDQIKEDVIFIDNPNSKVKIKFEVPDAK